jgi:hypothetical protein
MKPRASWFETPRRARLLTMRVWHVIRGGSPRPEEHREAMRLDRGPPSHECRRQCSQRRTPCRSNTETNAPAGGWITRTAVDALALGSYLDFCSGLFLRKTALSVTGSVALPTSNRRVL